MPHFKKFNFFQETAASLPPSKINEEKKQREHLLQMNQILAQQVMQMSKIVAGKWNLSEIHRACPATRCKEKISKKSKNQKNTKALQQTIYI